MISLAAVTEALKIESDAETGFVARLIDAARAHLEVRTGFYFGPLETRVEILAGVGKRTLWLSDPPQESGESVSSLVVITEHALPGAEGVEVDPDTYRVRGRALERLGVQVWTRDYEYVATYAAGYALDAGPEDALQDAHRLVGLWYANRELGAVPVDMDFATPWSPTFA